jgi:hypothetical protein
VLSLLSAHCDHTVRTCSTDGGYVARLLGLAVSPRKPRGIDIGASLNEHTHNRNIAA